MAEQGLLTVPHVEEKKKKRPPKRYWEETNTQQSKGGEEPTGEKEKSEEEAEQARGTAKQKQKSPRDGPKPRRRKNEPSFVSRKTDPFPGDKPIPVGKLQKYQRGEQNKVPREAGKKLKEALKSSRSLSELAQKQAARFDVLLPEDAGFLEGEDGEDTCFIAQEDIADAVDLTSGAKYFNLHLSQFGPYRLDYSKTGRHLLLGGRRGHVTCIDWQTKDLMCEVNVMETVNDVKWLHTEAMFAVAQRKWLYIYDSKGVELHCVKKFNDVLRMQFLPYHFLLATASATGFLQYLDVSIGKEIAAIPTKMGRLDVMMQNPYNAVIHLGHTNGTVSLWSPNQREPLVKMLCHRGAVRSLALDKTGTYMVTSGLDRKLKVYDIRAFKPLHSSFLPAGASCLSLSQRGLLSAATGDVVQVYQNVWGSCPVSKPYMAHRVRGQVCGLAFCPFEDVLGIGHGQGFSSMIVPGAGEPNFDALDSNPFRCARQRQEWEVKALLEKLQPELIGMDPNMLSKIDQVGFETRHREQVEALGYDPLQPEKFKPRNRMKGRSSAGSVEKRKKKVAHVDQRDVIKQSVEEKMQRQKELEEKKKECDGGQKSALDRFKK
ncbi:hypothetical protein DNTS_003552 [Danionella cerebrum]|uniref:WD repeat-containing protein 46 n=1 Tax=Danionella cerebrum TaxID=2873325 RepID=A0A553QZM5_9TELE|nr:hypothetical protein DNTS_003552 [Danionella translucida]